MAYPKGHPATVLKGKKNQKERVAYLWEGKSKGLPDIPTHASFPIMQFEGLTDNEFWNIIGDLRASGRIPKAGEGADHRLYRVYFRHGPHDKQDGRRKISLR